ncbi:hypothetical protein FVB32_06860 [Flagellimonas hymeniacidonis]|uniref:Redox-active disulfide protein 2 n=1 Tax=Flagellimonas hymeniacidonis TaxID=2603628 RepID=A0A5C8V9A8_9FLAO|nr:hypothetical protein [Flagellimonas hymeniacidonis]TXN38006.1 hypothetical protein FVB32_06860 [Flagellimonas hymeniacidonis]
MKNQKIKAQSSEELKQSIKTIKAIVGMLIGTSVLLLGTVLYLFFVKKDSSMLPLLFVLIGSMAIVAINLRQAKRMKAELDFRQKK